MALRFFWDAVDLPESSCLRSTDHEASQSSAEGIRSTITSGITLACLESLAGNFIAAFEALQNAAREEEFDKVSAWHDPDLQAIRDDHRFEEIVGPNAD